MTDQIWVVDIYTWLHLKGIYILIAWGTCLMHNYEPFLMTNKFSKCQNFKSGGILSCSQFTLNSNMVKFQKFQKFLLFVIAFSYFLINNHPYTAFQQSCLVHPIRLHHDSSKIFLISPRSWLKFIYWSVSDLLPEPTDIRIIDNTAN